jgi:hypothetical protein
MHCSLAPDGDAVYGIRVAGVLLASIGLYGVMSYSVNQRTREIGIRMARGAKASQVQAMVVRGGLRLVLMATVLGIPLAFASARLTGSLLYGVTPWDVETFTAVPVFLTAISNACVLDSFTVGISGRPHGHVAKRVAPPARECRLEACSSKKYDHGAPSSERAMEIISLDLCCIAPATRMATFAHDLRGSLGALTVGAAVVFTLLRHTATCGVGTFLWIAHSFTSIED